jgi:hypothetical protein
MRLPEYDHVVEAFATNRSDEPLNVTVLPRRAWRRRMVADPQIPIARMRRVYAGPKAPSRSRIR